MANDDWYKNETWSYQTESEFENRLRRSHDPRTRAVYLRTQAGFLLDSVDEQNQAAGIQLSKRLIQDYPAEQASVILAQEQLGDFYFKKGNFPMAENLYRIVTDFYYKNTRSGTSGIADIKLVDCILKTNQAMKFPDAYNMLTTGFQRSEGNLILNDHKFYYAEILAMLCDKIEKKEEARQYAKQALELSKITDPQFRQKSLGIIKITDAQLQELQRIAGI